MRLTVAVLVVALISITSLFARTGGGDYERVERLLTGNTTVVDETIHYPQGEPTKVSALIVTMAPGETTGWHTHGVPLFAYVLDGEIENDYGPKGVRTYKTGEAFLEAMAVRHNSVNKGANPARILVVFMGAEGLKNVEREDAQAPSAQ